MPPVSFASTYAQSSPGEHAGFEYSRSHNPTRYAWERCIARLEGSELSESDDVTYGGFAFASGLAAIATLLDHLPANAKVVASDDLYGGTHRLFRQVRARSAGLRFEFVDASDPNKVADAVDAETALIWVETPTNPMLKVVDLAAIAIGYNIWLPLYLVFIGVMLGATTIIAQDYGAGRVQRTNAAGRAAAE